MIKGVPSNQRRRLKNSWSQMVKNVIVHGPSVWEPACPKAELKKMVAAKEQEIQIAEKKFKEAKAEIEKSYRQTKKDLTGKIRAVRKPGLALMKAVRAMKKDPTIADRVKQEL